MSITQLSIISTLFLMILEYKMVWFYSISKRIYNLSLVTKIKEQRLNIKKKTWTRRGRKHNFIILFVPIVSYMCKSPSQLFTEWRSDMQASELPRHILSPANELVNGTRGGCDRCPLWIDVLCNEGHWPTEKCWWSSQSPGNLHFPQSLRGLCERFY